MMEVFGRIWKTLAGTRSRLRPPKSGGVVGTLRPATALLIALIALAGLAVFEALSPAEAQAPVAVTVAFEASTYTVAESDDSSTTDVTENAVEVKVTLSADPLREVIIPITRTNQGGATNSDYSGVPTSVTFASGDTEKTFTFTATPDTADDDEDQVKLSFGTLPAGVTAGATAETTVSITDDDDPQVTVSFASAAYTAYEGPDIIIIVVKVSAAPERNLRIPFTQTLQGGASATDYTFLAAANIAEDETEFGFRFEAIPDTDADHGESVLLGFGTLPPGVTLGDTTTTTVTIIDPASPDPCHSPEIASVGGDASRWNVLWVWQSSPARSRLPYRRPDLLHGRLRRHVHRSGSPAGISEARRLGIPPLPAGARDVDSERGAGVRGLRFRGRQLRPHPRQHGRVLPSDLLQQRQEQEGPAQTRKPGWSRQT